MHHYLRLNMSNSIYTPSSLRRLPWVYMLIEDLMLSCINFYVIWSITNSWYWSSMALFTTFIVTEVKHYNETLPAYLESIEYREMLRHE